MGDTAIRHIRRFFPEGAIFRGRHLHLDGLGAAPVPAIDQASKKQPSITVFNQAVPVPFRRRRRLALQFSFCGPFIFSGPVSLLKSRAMGHPKTVTRKAFPLTFGNWERG